MQSLGSRTFLVQWLGSKRFVVIFLANNTISDSTLKDAVKNPLWARDCAWCSKPAKDGRRVKMDMIRIRLGKLKTQSSVRKRRQRDARTSRHNVSYSRHWVKLLKKPWYLVIKKTKSKRIDQEDKCMEQAIGNN